MFAAFIGHGAVVQLLLENGADIKVKGIAGMTPLMAASLKGHEAVVQMLLGHVP